MVSYDLIINEIEPTELKNRRYSVNLLEDDYTRYAKPNAHDELKIRGCKQSKK